MPDCLGKLIFTIQERICDFTLILIMVQCLILTDVNADVILEVHTMAIFLTCMLALKYSLQTLFIC